MTTNRTATGEPIGASSYRIMVTWKGETGYLQTTVLLNLRTIYGMTMNAADADTYVDFGRAERAAAKVRERFEGVAIEDTQHPWEPLTAAR